MSISIFPSNISLWFIRSALVSVLVLQSAHAEEKVYCPSGSMVRSVVLDTILKHTHAGYVVSHLKPITFKHGGKHKWKLEMSFFPDKDQAIKEANQFKFNVYDPMSSIPEKQNGKYYCQYASQDGKIMGMMTSPISSSEE